MSRKSKKIQPKGSVRKNFTDQQIADALKESGGVISVAARRLKIARKTLSNWVQEMGKKSSIRLDDYKPETTLKLPKKKKQRYVVTCAQNNTSLHEEFFKTLLGYCEHNNAQLIVIPIRYKNVTAFIETLDYIPWYPPEIKPYTLNGPFYINDNLVVMGDFKIQATAANPLSGLGAMGQHRSVILGHPQLQMNLVPTPHYELPRQLLTTGSISRKNYSSSKAGQKASFHHTFGAAVCEVDGDKFWTRQINATDDGSFYDLDTYYSPNNDPVSGIPLAGLVCGDLHNDFLDDGVKSATWTDPDSIVNVLKPENIYLHDVFDAYSISHHHRHNFFTRYAKHHSGMGNLERELDRLVENHNTIWGKDKNCKIHYIASNHNEALLRWLNEADPRQDPENALIYHRLMLAVLEETRMSKFGAEKPDPLALYVKSRIINPENTFFHSRTDKVLLHNIDLGQHGDAGANGGRGSLQTFAKSGYKSVTGHGHSPGFYLGAYRTGTSSYLKREYNQAGYNSNLHTHCFIYQNGKRTLNNIIKGEWRS